MCDRLGRLAVRREGVQMHVKTANVRTFSLDIGRLTSKNQVEALLINGARLELSSELRFGLVHFHKDSESHSWQVCVFSVFPPNLHEAQFKFIPCFLDRSDHPIFYPSLNPTPFPSRLQPQLRWPLDHRRSLPRHTLPRTLSRYPPRARSRPVLQTRRRDSLGRRGHSAAGGRRTGEGEYRGGWVDRRRRVCEAGFERGEDGILDGWKGIEYLRYFRPRSLQR